MKKRYEEVIRKSEFNIKVIEKSGLKIKNLLHKKDPFKRDSCNRNNCFVCTSDGKGKQICNKENIVYQISCKENCNNHDVYKGETSYSAFTRGLEHLTKYESRDTNSMLHNHCETYHNGRRVKFKMDILKTFHKDPTSRQIREGIEIEQTPKRRLMNTKNEWNSSQIPQISIQRR